MFLLRFFLDYFKSGLVLFTILFGLLLHGCAYFPEALDEPTQAVVGVDGRLYVSDGYSNGRIAVFDTDGQFVTSWGTKGFGREQFITPHSLAQMSDGSILVADRGNARIQRLSAKGEFIEQWHGEKLGRPWSVAVAKDDTVFVVDGGDQDASAPRSGLVKLDKNGKILCRWGRFGKGEGELNWGHMLAVSPKGLYVVDLKNRRILKFAKDPKGECGFKVVPNWSKVSFWEKSSPLGIAVHNGRVYVSMQQAGEPILVLDEESGEELASLGKGLFTIAHGLYVDDKSIWVTDRAKNRVTRLSLEGKLELHIGGR